MKNKKIVIGVLLVATLIMAVGYSIFSTALNISGTANIASTWSVMFTGIEEVSKTSGVTVKSAPTASGTSATFNVDFKSPGDKIGKGSTREITVEMGYREEITSQPIDVENKLTISVECVQNIGQSIPSSDINIEKPTLTTVTGTNTLTLSNSVGRALASYKIYGNSIQNGTPSPSSPVTITSLGDNGTILVEVYTDSNSKETYTIDVSKHEPLRSIDDAYDYIDFENKRIVRYIYKYEFTGQEEIRWFKSQNTDETAGFYWVDPLILGTYGSPTFTLRGISTHYPRGATSHELDNTLRVGFIPQSAPPYISFRTTQLNLDDFRQFLLNEKAKGTPVTVYFSLNSPIYESISLPTIYTTNNNCTVKVYDSNITASKLELSYYKK